MLESINQNDNDLMKTISENLRRVRKANGYTMEQIAEIIGVTRTGYSNYENAKRPISLQSLLTLSKLYNMPIDELVGNPNPIGRNKVLPFKTYGYNNGELKPTTCKTISVESDAVIVVKIDEFKNKFFYRCDNMQIDKEMLLECDGEMMITTVLSDNDTGTIILYSNSKTKLIPRKSLQDRVVFLGVYAGEHTKEINIDSFF